MREDTTLNQDIGAYISHCIVTAVILCGLTLNANAAQNCKRGEYYFDRVERAGDTLPTRDGIAMLERAVESCSRWEYWQKLAEVADASDDRSLQARAAEAYVEAYDIASTDEQRALSAGHYGEMLLDNNDPQRALTYIHHARNLTPDDPWLDDLAKRVNQAVTTVDVTQIKRGLADIGFKPLRLYRMIDEKVGSGGGSGNPLEINLQTINVPIQFEVSSANVNASTRKNIEVLASSLADPTFSGEAFLLVGHADVRGGSLENLMLSQQRAKAIRSIMLELEPALAGRLRTKGKGSSAPLSLGTSFEDHQINRRLEVVVVSSK